MSYRLFCRCPCDSKPPGTCSTIATLGTLKQCQKTHRASSGLGGLQQGHVGLPYTASMFIPCHCLHSTHSVMVTRMITVLTLVGYLRYRIAGNFCGAKHLWFEHWTTNILPTNEATLPTFTCSASSNQEYKNYELTNTRVTQGVMGRAEAMRLF